MATTSEPLILVIDLGTTACKVGLCTPNGHVVAYVQEADATPVSFLEGGGAEQDPADWWRVITASVRRLWEETGVPRERIAGIASSAHWSGTVAVDRAGRPLANAIIWMDTRGASLVREMSGGFPSVAGYRIDKLLAWLRLTGGVPTHSGKDPIAHILYLKRHAPDLYRQTYKFLEPKDYLNLQFTGRFASDYATVTLHWLTDNRQIQQVDYDPRLLKFAGLDVAKLPKLYPTTHVLGPLLPAAAEALDLPPGLPVVIGAPDVQAPALGSGAVQDFEPHLYVGTSSWLSCHVPFKKTDLFHNMASLPAALPGRYLIANEQETSGVCLTFLRDRLFFADDVLETGPAPEDAYRRLDALAAEAPAGAGGLLFTPWLYGERTPVEEATLRGGFYNLSLNTSRADVVRAVFEGVALNTRWLLKYLERFIQRPFGAINFVGGGANSAIWSQIFADVLRKPIRQVAHPEAAGLRGVGVLAGLSLKMTTLDDYARHVEIRQTFHPDPTQRSLYDELFQAYLDVYKRMSSLYARLNQSSHPQMEG